MTIQEMYQEIEDQTEEDILNSYSEQYYDDLYSISIEIDYTIQE